MGSGTRLGYGSSRSFVEAKEGCCRVRHKLMVFGKLDGKSLSVGLGGSLWKLLWAGQ
jgi:hypothetical protein